MRNALYEGYPGFYDKESGEVENGPGSRHGGSQMLSFLDLDLSQQAFRRAQGLTIHACPPVLAIHT